MRAFILGLAGGTVLLQTRAELPGLALLLAILAAVLALGLLARYRGHAIVQTSALFGCGLLCGFAWAAVMAQARLSEELPKDLEGRDIVLVGVVANLPYRFEQGIRFEFLVERAVSEGGDLSQVPRQIALSWYGGAGAQQVPVLRPGERWQLNVRLRRPHGNANPHGFDYEAWLLSQGMRATGYVRQARAEGDANRRLDAFVFSPSAAIARAREWLQGRLEESLAGKKYAGVIVALVIGEQRAISQSDWKVFNRTGVSHLMSISGLHITMIAGMVAALVLALWRRSFFTRAQLPLLRPAQKAAAAAGALAALSYVALAGFGVPAQRTLYMLSVVAIALWTGRLASVSHVLCAALALVILLDPWAVLWPGFWLSFGAVAIILYATVGRAEPAAPASRPLAMLAAGAHTQYVVTLGLVPFTVLLFGQISLVSPFANAIAIPLVSFLVTPLSLLGSVLPAPLSGWVLGAAHALVGWLAGVLDWMASLRIAVWMAPVPPWWMFLLALAGALWLLAPRGWPVRWLGALAWLPLVLNTATRPGAGEMWVTAFDVGQGTALLIETSRHRLLYDAGPAYSPEADGGSRVILPYLRGRGIAGLDGLVVSHSDSDHVGGALSVLGELPVGSLWSSLPEGHAVLAGAPLHRRCEAGQSWHWDGVRFEMLHPSATSYANPALKPNARSCTLKITAGPHAILLTGDIEAPQEMQLLRGDADRLRASVLLAPHHGSGTSSTLAFLQAVQPQIALFQVGYRNRYRHPKQEVFDRYSELGIRRLRSDESGAVNLRFGAALEVAEYRVESKRYWHGR